MFQTNIVEKNQNAHFTLKNFLSQIVPFMR